jgi:hypothetical protein
VGGLRLRGCFVGVEQLAEEFIASNPIDMDRFLDRRMWIAFGTGCDAYRAADGVVLVGEHDLEKCDAIFDDERPSGFAVCAIGTYFLWVDAVLTKEVPRSIGETQNSANATLTL